MADGVKMSYSELEGYSKKFQTEADNLNSSIDRMYKQVQQLKSGWNGDAAQGFENKLNSLKKGFKDTQQVIDSISKDLVQSARDMREFDESMSRKYNQKQFIKAVVHTM